MTKLKKILLILLATPFTMLHAANPSTTTISVTIPALVQISGLNNITLSPTNFSNPITGDTTACIYTNVISPLGSYYVTATGNNASAGAFRVTNGSAFITYSAFWNSTSPTQTTPLVSGTKTTQQLGGSSTSLTCGGTPNADFNISFTSTQVAGAPAATYTDTVTLLISPS